MAPSSGHFWEIMTYLTSFLGLDIFCANFALLAAIRSSVLVPFSVAFGDAFGDSILTSKTTEIYKNIRFLMDSVKHLHLRS